MVFGGRPSTAAASTVRPWSGPSRSSATIVGPSPLGSRAAPDSGDGSGWRPNRAIRALEVPRPRGRAEVRHVVGLAREARPRGRVGVLELGQAGGRPRTVQALVEGQALAVVGDLRAYLGHPVGAVLE